MLYINLKKRKKCLREHQQRHKCDVLGPSDGAITGQGKATAHRIKRKDPLDWPDSNRCFLMENKPKWFWESGHLITRRFGGENSTQNLTTQTSWLNSEGIRNQASVSHYEALANAFFEQVFGVTLDDFVKEPITRSIGTLKTARMKPAIRSLRWQPIPCRIRRKPSLTRSRSSETAPKKSPSGSKSSIIVQKIAPPSNTI